MITIHHANGSLQIGGTGAERVSERLRLILDTIAQGDSSLEKVLFQGDTNVYIKGPLSTKGEIILTSKNLTIRTTDGLESYIFDKKELNTPCRYLEPNSIWIKTHHSYQTGAHCNLW